MQCDIITTLNKCKDHLDNCNKFSYIIEILTFFVKNVNNSTELLAAEKDGQTEVDF